MELISPGTISINMKLKGKSNLVEIYTLYIRIRQGNRNRAETAQKNYETELLSFV